MPDIDKARRAINSIRALPNASKEAKYYADLALSHLQPSASGSVECPHCHWGFAPSVIEQHIREKH